MSSLEYEALKWLALHPDCVFRVDADGFVTKWSSANAMLDAARLEGAKAMQEAAGGLGKHIVSLLPFSIPDVSSPLYKIAENNITTYSKFITILDPQQVIQEKA